MTSRNIKKFDTDIQVADSGVFASKNWMLLKHIIDDLRDKGYIPVLDLDPVVVVDYKNDIFNYCVSVYGVYVGKKKSWQYEGMTSGKLIPRTTVPVKSKPPLKG